MLTPREKLVLDCIRCDPTASQDAIASKLGLSRSAVAVHITNLSAKGAIRGRAYVLGDSPYVAAVGGAAVDIGGRAAKKLRRGDSNPGTISLSPGGVARNVAETLASLGVECRLISAIGDDYYGRFLSRRASEAGIDTSGLAVRHGARTASYLSIFDDTGELEAGISDMEVLDTIDATLLRQHDNSLRHASAIFIDANLPDEALRHLFDRHADKTIVADPVSEAKAPRLVPYLPHIDILKPTLAEAGAMLGKTIRSRRQAASVARALRERGVRQVFVSLGPRGAFAADDSASELVPAEASTVTSVNGAGDAFVAALIAGSLEGLSLSRLAAFGNAVASVRLSPDAALGDAADLRALADNFLSRETSHA